MKVMCLVGILCLLGGLFSCPEEKTGESGLGFELILTDQKDIVTNINGQIELPIRLNVFYAGSVPQEFYLKIKDLRCKAESLGDKLVLEVLPLELKGIKGETIYVEDQEGNPLATGPKLTVEKCYRMVSSTNSTSDFFALGSLSAFRDNQVIAANLNKISQDQEAELYVQSLDSLFDRYRIDRLGYNKECKKVQIDFPVNEKKYEYWVVTHPVIGGSTWSEKTKTFYTYIPTGYYSGDNIQEVRHRIMRYGEGNERAEVYGLEIEAPVIDMAVDSKGVLYILEKGACYIKYNNGNYANFLVYAGDKKKSGYVDGNLAESRFRDIVALAIDREDNLYVAQSTCIRMITPGGVVKTIAGTAEKGDKSGNIADVRFKDIRGMALAGNGAIYIIDTDYSKVKILNPERTYVEEIGIEADADYLNIAEVIEVDDLHEEKVYQANRPMYVADNGLIYYMVPVGKYYYINVLVPDEFVPEKAWYKRVLDYV